MVSPHCKCICCKCETYRSTDSNDTHHCHNTVIRPFSSGVPACLHQLCKTCSVFLAFYYIVVIVILCFFYTQQPSYFVRLTCHHQRLSFVLGLVWSVCAWQRRIWAWRFDGLRFQRPMCICDSVCLYIYTLYVCLYK